MNPVFVNDLMIVAYLICGTFSIAVIMGWALAQFGPTPINCGRVTPHIVRQVFR
jgi:hypothetical protein